MKFAVVDIGSNAIRLQISKVIEDKEKVHFKKQEFVRFPLRLGKDVFELNKISYNTEEKFLKLMTAFKNLIDLYEVDDTMICATSAMREANNRRGIIKRIYYNIGLNIEIIDGAREAELLNKAILMFLENQTMLHIDVGGGSTELNLIHNRKKVSSESFRIGSVRQLTGKQNKDTFNEMSEWFEEASKSIDADRLVAMGTGGNINKMFELAQKTENQTMTLGELETLRNHIKSYSFQERMVTFQMNQDRADVIIPGSNIYIQVMKMAGINEILVPKVGLKDGMVIELYEKHKNLQKVY